MPATSINLLPHRDFEQTSLGKLLRWALTYGRYIIVSTEIVVLMAFIYRFSLDRKITDLNDEIEQKAAIITANQAFEDQFRNLQFRANEIGTLFVNQDVAARVIHHLEQITPQGITYTTFTFSENKISVEALANSNTSLAAFVNQLKQSNVLTQINLSNLSKKTLGVAEIRFQLDAVIVDNQSPTTN